MIEHNPTTPPDSFSSTNPLNGQVLAHYPVLPLEQALKDVKNCHQAQKRWQRLSPENRAEILREMARLLELEAHDHAALMSREMGKPFKQALSEVHKCALTLRHYANHGPALLKDSPAPTEAKASYIRHVPMGVILAVMPWNFPFWQFFRFAAPALLAGNAALLKHAPSTMGSAEAITSLCLRAGAPKNLVTNLPIREDDVHAILADPHVAALTLTGSTRAGKALAALAGASLKPSVLELGGADPFIVMPTSDLELAVQTAIDARLQNNGQSCIAAKRFFIHEAIYGDFKAKLLDKLEQLNVGDPMDESVDLGPLSSEKALLHLQALVDQSVQSGDRLLSGGKALNRPGFFFPATVIEVLDPTGDIANQEFFGPVFLLSPVKDLSEAIAYANHSIYGLSASLWTQDKDEKERAIQELEAGAVFINSMSRSDPRLPFGGVKSSGYGRELGELGLFSFTSAKSIWIDT